MQKKEYLSPEFSFMRIELSDVIMSSVEELSSRICDPSDWGVDPFFDDEG